MSAQSVTRYVVAHDNGSKFAHARQGRYTYAAPADAQAWIDAAMKNNDRATLESVYRLPLSVAACECYPGHFDPCGWPEPINN